MTPKVLPAISGPVNSFLPASTAFSTLSQLSFSPCTQVAPAMMRLEDANSPARTSSFTAFAFAPGVLNTGTPFCVHFSMGMLFVPAPARATASRLSFSSILCISKLRRMMPSGFSAFSSITKFCSGSFASPVFAMLFKVRMVYIMSLLFRYKKRVVCHDPFGFYLFSISNFFMNSTNFSTPSMGIALYILARMPPTVR